MKLNGDMIMKVQLLDQSMTLTHFILDGKRSYVDSLRNTPCFDGANEKYKIDRKKILSEFCKLQLISRSKAREVKLFT